MNRYKFDEAEHHHSLDGKPLVGTSTVVGVISKPLTYWASGMAVGTLGWTATKSDPAMRLEVATVALEGFKGLDGKGWLKRLDLAYKAHATRLKEAAVDGTDLHAELERFVKNTMANRIAQYPDKIMPFIEWATENVETWLFSEGYCYSEALWVGGISDAGAKMKDGSLALFDFKSSKEAYFNQYVQLGGYALEIEENGILDAEGNSIDAFNVKYEKLYVVPFGADDVTPREYHDIEYMKQMFTSAVQLYKGNDNFGK